MITKELRSFLVTAQSGSFQKASEQLFLSSTALIKQINVLEEEVGVQLFYRTNKGITLTEAGKIFYDAALDIMERYYNAIQSAKEVQKRNVNPIRFGFSQINPHRLYDDLIICNPDFYKQFTTHIIPISSEYKDFINELRNLGENVDIIPYFLGHEGLNSVCATFCLAKLPLCIAVPVNHPLYELEVLNYDDLNNYDLISIKSEANSYYKSFNNDILSKTSNVNFEYTNYYDFRSLNYAVSSNKLILVGDYLKHSHPLLKLIPVNWENYLPYGLHYSSSPSPAVFELLQAFRDKGISGNVDDAMILNF